MRLKISLGNTKLGSIPNLNLPPVTTCPEGVPCVKDCYARKAWRQYPVTRKAWSSNLTFYREDPDKFFFEWHDYLTRKEPEVFRVHSAGDMPDRGYWDRLQDLITCHDTIFLIFTKRYDFDYTKKPKNASVVLSVWPGLDLPENTDLPWAWLYEDRRRPEDAYYFLCPGSCADCHVCWDKLSAGVHVCFKKH